jgi:chitodextrinase
MYVQARDAAGNTSSASNTLVVKTLDNQPPGVPIGLTSQDITSSSITFSWMASTDNVGVSSYDVYLNGNLAISVTTTSATITGLSSGVKYVLTVVARDAAGNVSDISNSLIINTINTAVPSVTEKLLQFYPNPAIDKINTELEEDSKIDFLDMSGKVLLSKIAKAGQVQIPFTLNSGTYIIRVIGKSNSVRSSKLIVN